MVMMMVIWGGLMGEGEDNREEESGNKLRIHSEGVAKKKKKEKKENHRM